MRLLGGAFLLVVLMCGAVASRASFISASQQSVSATQQPGPTASAQQSTNQEINDRYVQQIMEKIAARKSEPAEQVFKNIQWLKGVPADRLLLIMNRGYSRALGVACTHCHVEQDFASDEKRAKRAAREMAVMHRMINQELGKMKELETKPESRAISCSTCHRGAINPS